MDWNQQKVLVTGGASFISSHLIDHLVEKGARSVRVVDDLTSGRLANIQGHVDSGVVEFRQEDLLQPGVAQRAVEGIDVVFHLAAIHGGRGFVDLHQAACAQNLAMDGILVKAAYE
ncbi:MAG TPA: NAD-dependent epimerase/dehydratase family protein, partial [Thermoanaerobaculia bacterium]